MSERGTMNELDETTEIGEASEPVKQVKPAKQDRTTLALLFVAALVAIGGMGFAAGRVTAPGTTAGANPNMDRPGIGRNMPSFAPGQSFNLGQFGNGGTRGLDGLGGGVSGTVQSINGSTMTVQLANGTTVTVDLTGTTTYHSTTTASSADIKTGISVTVQIDATSLAAGSLAPGASGVRTVTAKDVLITKP